MFAPESGTAKIERLVEGVVEESTRRGLKTPHIVSIKKREVKQEYKKGISSILDDLDIETLDIGQEIGRAILYGRNYIIQSGLKKRITKMMQGNWHVSVVARTVTNALGYNLRMDHDHSADH